MTSLFLSEIVLERMFCSILEHSLLLVIYINLWRLLLRAFYLLLKGATMGKYDIYETVSNLLFWRIWG